MTRRMMMTLHAGLLALLTFFAMLPVALADDEYKNVEPGQMTEQVSAPLFVSIAYGLIWTVIILYLVALWRRQARISAELLDLRRSMSDR